MLSKIGMLTPKLTVNKNMQNMASWHGGKNGILAILYKTFIRTDVDTEEG